MHNTALVIRDPGEAIGQSFRRGDRGIQREEQEIRGSMWDAREGVHDARGVVILEQPIVAVLIQGEDRRHRGGGRGVFIVWLESSSASH